MYKYDISSVCKPFKKEQLKKGKLMLCIYYANTSLEIPFIEYLLYKYNDGPLKDTMIFPFIEYNTQHSLENQIRMFFSKVFTESIEGKQIEIKGLLGDNCLFIDISFFLQTYKETLGILKTRVDCWWFTTLYEMINTKYIYDIPIHTTVTSLFLDNPILAKIDYKDTLVENPIVLYNGYTYNRCLYVVIFGKNKSFSNAYYGHYYYFSDFEGAKHYAITKKDERLGIIRSVLFTKKTKIIINSPTDKKTDLSMLERLSKKQQELYARIYSPYGDWGKTYDTIFIHRPVLDDGTTIQSELNVVCVDNNDTIVLNWAELDTSNKTKNIQNINII
jgi:hypothetical protein